MQWHGVSFYVKFKTQKQQMPLSRLFEQQGNMTQMQLWVGSNWNKSCSYVELKRGKNKVFEINTRWYQWYLIIRVTSTIDLKFKSKQI